MVCYSLTLSERAPPLTALNPIIDRMRAGIVDVNVLYRSLLGLASSQQASGALVREGGYSLKWIAAAKYANGIPRPFCV